MTQNKYLIGGGQGRDSQQVRTESMTAFFLLVVVTAAGVISLLAGLIGGGL